MFSCPHRFWYKVCTVRTNASKGFNQYFLSLSRYISVEYSVTAVSCELMDGLFLSASHCNCRYIIMCIIMCRLNDKKIIWSVFLSVTSDQTYFLNRRQFYILENKLCSFSVHQVSRVLPNILLALHTSVLLMWLLFYTLLIFIIVILHTCFPLC